MHDGGGGLEGRVGVCGVLVVWMDGWMDGWMGKGLLEVCRSEV